MPVLESDLIGRAARRTADLYDLPDLVWLPHCVAMHVEPVTDGGLHVAPSLFASVPGVPQTGMGRLSREEPPGRGTAQRPRGPGRWLPLSRDAIPARTYHDWPGQHKSYE